MGKNSRKTASLVLGGALALALIFVGVFSILPSFMNGSGGKISYTINQYQGKLDIHEDNTATYTQSIRYQFDDSFRGQYVTFGLAGKVPKDFDAKITGVQAKKLVKSTDKQDKNQDINLSSGDIQTTRQENSLLTKVYNSGGAGDTVELTVTYQVVNPLFTNKDVFVLNWVPISDWQAPLNNVKFTVNAPKADKTALAAHLGDFNEQVKVNQTSTGYEFTARKISKAADLGIHAYWSAQAFPALLSGVDSLGLPDYDKTENSIRSNTQLINLLVYTVLPLVLSGLLVILLVVIARLYVKLHVKVKLGSNMRLYQLPNDLPPLWVASQVYSSDLDELSPSGNNVPINFKNLVMSVLTDLIDRKVLVIQGETLSKTGKYQESNQLSSSERLIVDFVFGRGVSSITFEEAFGDYKVTGRGSKENQRSEGVRIKSGFEAMQSKIAHLVREELSQERLPNLFRPLSAKEKTTLFIGTALLWLLAIFSVILGLLCVIPTYLSQPLPWLLVYGLVFGLSVSVGLWTASASVRYGRDGVPNESGTQAQFEWNSFANMLKDIAHLEDDKIESIVLWNRYLVFATMFGYAEQVIKLINTRGILLGGGLEHYNTGFYYPFYWGIGGSLDTTVSDFTSASHIDTSSGSGGFSSGGGFSGGGGGGGGGAF